jgi:ribosomal protein S18
MTMFEKKYEDKEWTDRPPRPDRDDRDGYDRDSKMDFDAPDMDGGDDKDKRRFSRRKSCWFCAKKTEPDWKNTESYSWLVNEFGKIAPSRVSGICATHQRKATEAIKRARHIGFIGYVSNEITR